MRRHAKASTTGTTQCQAKSLGRFCRGALPIRAASGDTGGRGAPSLRPIGVLAFFALLVLAPSAQAASTRVYQSSFGALSNPQALAVDQASGDVYVLDVGVGKVLRFKANGEPDPFSASASYIAANELSGSTEGAFSFFGGASEQQLAVAPPGSPAGTAGNLYVTESGSGAVDTFAPSGEYLGRITQAGGSGFSEACGVAVDPAGNIYVGDYGGSVDKYVPSANPPSNADYDSMLTGVNHPCNVAAGPGSVYASTWAQGPLTKYPASLFPGGGGSADASSGGTAIERDGGPVTSTTAYVDPSNGDVYVDEGNRASVFDSSGALLYSFGSAADFGTESVGVAVDPSIGNAYVADRTAGEIDVFGPVSNPTTATTNPATTVHHTSAVLNGHLDRGEDPGITACHFEWGTTVAYGNTAPCNEGDTFTAPTDVTANLSGLTPGTPIHFRLDISSTSSGDFQGEDQSFTPDPFSVLHSLIASFGPDGTAATSFSENTRLAFRQGSEKLYVFDGGAPGIFGFDASAPPAFSSLAGFAPLPTAPGGNSPYIAVDNTALGSAGNVYFVSANFGGGTGQVYGFDSTGAPLGGNFPINPETNPGAPAGSPTGICGTAVDSTGNVWVRNLLTGRVLEYNAAGVFQSSVDVSAQGFGCPIAFDSADNLYVGSNETRKYTATSGYTTSTQIGPAQAPSGLAVDPSTDELYIAHSNSVDEFTSGGTLLSEFATDVGGSNFEGIAVDATNHYVYLSDFSSAHKIRVFGPGVAQMFPTITPGTPTAVTDTSATLHAKVDPESMAVTDCHFEYGTTTSYGQSAPCVPPPGAGSGDVAVSAALGALNGGTTYHFRIVAANANGTSRGGDQTFTTPGPAIGAQFAEDVSFSDATVSAKINPLGTSTTYHVEYGTSDSYGQSTPESLPVSFQGDETAHTVSVHIGALAPSTAYHFRFVATSSGGTSRGLDARFATYSPSPSFGSCPNDRFRGGAGARLSDCRAYEQATPIDKHGANAQGSLALIQASSAGDRVSFFISGGLPASGGSAGLVPYMASRGPSGWSSDGLLPATPANVGAGVIGWSDDLATTLVSGPGPGNVGRAFYLRDSDTAAFQLGAATPTPHEASVADFAADTSHLIFETDAELVPGAAAGKSNLYELDHGTLSLPGRIPVSPATSCDDAGGPACVPAPDGAFAGPYGWFTGSTDVGGAGAGYYTRNTLSRDGSRVFFTTRTDGQLYVRENDTATVQVSASQRTVPDPNGSKPAAFLAATPDGSKVFFASCEKLTEDSTAVSTAATTCVGPQQGQDLYSYDVESGELTDLTVDANVGDSKGAAVQGILGTSDDGSYVYFAANGALAPGTSPADCGDNGSPCNFYVSHDGATKLVAQGGAADLTDWTPTPEGGMGAGPKTSRVSADGRTLLFASTESLTGYDNSSVGCGDFGKAGPCAEFFRYTAPEEELACVSCNPTGTPPARSVALGTTGGFLADGLSATFLTRNLSADGKRVFFSSPDALLATDTNGVNDAYEWEAEGSGTCHTPGGCTYLLSTGTSPAPSYFADASANGDHAFLFTSQQLVPSDGDQLADVYDASVGGGLSSQNTLAPPTCASTACQSNLAPPPEQTPSSAAFSGSGSAPQRPAARGCPKGKRKIRRAGKVRCQKAGKQHKRHHNRGGSK